MSLRDLITTTLELAGLLAVAAGVAMLLATIVGLWLGLIVGGLVLVGESALLEWRRRP